VLVEPNPSLQTQPLEPAVATNLSPNLIDESILGELLLPQLGEVELLTKKASNEVELKLSEAGSDAVELTDQLWLTDELLESVFS